MKRFVASALVVTGLALPVSAQRGGGRGGFAGHSAAGFSGGARAPFAPSARYSLGSAPQFSAGRGATAAPAFRITAANAARRPGYPGGIYRRQPLYGVGIPYSAGWVAGPGFYGLGDPGYSDAGYADPGYSDAGANYPAQPEYPPQGSYPAPGYAGPPYPEPPAPGDAYRPAYSAAPAVPVPEPESPDAVTLVFKDGRPSQQIHNYLLTRTTLYVRDLRRQVIPVDELDVAATQKVNRAAGVEFQLPVGAK